MGKRESLEAKLLDMQGHTIYLPYETPDHEEDVPAPRRRPIIDTWCRPTRAAANSFHHRRMIHITSDDGMQYLLLECLDGTYARNHTINFMGQGIARTYNDLTGVGPNWGFNGRMNMYRVNDKLVFSLRPWEREDGHDTILSVNGVDQVITLWPNGEYDMMGDGSRMFMTTRSNYRARAIYIDRALGLDVRALIAGFRDQHVGPDEEFDDVQLPAIPWDPGFLGDYLVNEFGDWITAGRMEKKVALAKVNAPIVSEPTKHRYLINDLKKSLLSEKWSSE